MTKKEKNRIIGVGAILVIIIVLLLVFYRKAPDESHVEQQLNETNRRLQEKAVQDSLSLQQSILKMDSIQDAIDRRQPANQTYIRNIYEQRDKNIDHISSPVFTNDSIRRAFANH